MSAALLSFSGLVRVHTNRTRRCWSVLDDSTGLLIGHCDRVILRDVVWRVGVSGAARVAAGGKRTVFATGRGFIVRGALSLPLTQPVTFNPRAGDVTFKDASGAALHSSALAVFGTYPRVRVEVPAPVAVYGYPVDLIEEPLTPVFDDFGPLF